ncbi:hypothetical protein [Burkholderia sp. BCC1993]|uniref:hypothetical protein n=1 Tax=Burkholderia sp. BCC1993 TaxID=2817444 RepID=UPI002AAF978D|nr:hypothetical protein [Burkholderia sp. BCC1993]
MKIRLLIYAILLAALEFTYLHWEISYNLSDLKNYTDTLLAASGMVFTIMGIWIAFLYPNALNRIVHQGKLEVADFSETLSETKRLENIVASVLKSAIAIVFVLALYLFKVIISKTTIYSTHAALFKASALAGITMMSIIQIEAILSVVFANIMFINDLHRKRENREMDSEL